MYHCCKVHTFDDHHHHHTFCVCLVVVYFFVHLWYFCSGMYFLPKQKFTWRPFFYFKFSENYIISVETAKVVGYSKHIQNPFRKFCIMGKWPLGRRTQLSGGCGGVVMSPVSLKPYSLRHKWYWNGVIPPHHQELCRLFYYTSECSTSCLLYTFERAIHLKELRVKGRISPKWQLQILQSLILSLLFLPRFSSTNALLNVCVCVCVWLCLFFLFL